METGTAHEWETLPIAPHGGRLVLREVVGEEARGVSERAAALPVIQLDQAAVADVLLLATGVYSPLDGFMTHSQYLGCVQEMRLPGGHLWPLPISLPVDEDTAADLADGREVVLADPAGRRFALLTVADIYAVQPQEEAAAVYRTTDPNHPGVAALLGRSRTRVGGPVLLLARPELPFAAWRLDPAETREVFRRRGWRRVVGFQTRNPVHRAHEYIQKCALETVDGLLLHPLVGETKQGDVRADVRMRSYEAVCSQYYPPDRVLLAVFPAAMRYAGPREAVFHALCRKNYGCTHFIVGRDHAGVGDYYGTYDAQHIFDELDPAEVGITPMYFDHAFFCTACGGMATVKTCPHGPDSRISLSGTRVREMLQAGECPPPEFTRPEVARVLMDAP